MKPRRPQVVDISERIARFFPLGRGAVQLEVVAGATGEYARGDAPVAISVVRMITWEAADDGTRSIRDIKEQELYMGWPVFYEDIDRIEAFFAALGDVLTEIPLDAAAPMMPHELMCTDALKLKRAHTREDFAAALRAKSRLGPLLSAQGRDAIAEEALER